MEESVDKVIAQGEKKKKDDEEEEEVQVLWFECSMCKMREVYETRETKPKFVRNVTFHEGCYLAKDPFTPPENKQFLMLGSDCHTCRSPVCQSPDCSLFYLHRYCQKCASTNRKIFPEQMRSKIKDPS